MIKIFLNKGREQSVLRRHPWIFSGAVQRIEGAPGNGDLVSVYDHSGKTLGVGHYQNSSICVRILQFGEEELPSQFWQTQIASAWRFRQAVGLPGDTTNMFRLVHGEGDGLPGLIIDIYGDSAVVQFHDSGMYRARAEILDSLIKITDLPIRRVFDKSADTLGDPNVKGVNAVIYESEPQQTDIFHENNIPFKVDWAGGQKTGFFLDQRENRALVQKYARGRHVLNAFSYTGGFSMYALAGGAKRVLSVDISQQAIDQAGINASLQKAELASRHEVLKADVVKSLKAQGRDFDMIVLDPPAFAKRMSARHRAIQAYKRLNSTAITMLPPGGLLFSFSCSQVVTRPIFEDTILAAALESRRKVRILHRLSQGPDHPINMYHPESEYLKGLVLQVE